ncbi:hypothetical protein [Psychrobacter frigidicola]|uniref:hypothetical protein n=1 Tax=Psychrobacter frigidicola TaxID=45611 RepID=UPI00191B1520|nr:hypothetical protein [Psychrobacter frigidicola]
MRYLYRSSVIIFSLLIAACSSAQKDSILQTIDLTESGYFLEGAAFTLTTQQTGCMLQGVGYSESGKREYVFQFDNNEINAAHYIESRYAKPIYIDNDPDIVETHKRLYKGNKDRDARAENNQEDDEAFLELFNRLYQRIDQVNLNRCGD